MDIDRSWDGESFWSTDFHRHRKGRTRREGEPSGSASEAVDVDSSVAGGGLQSERHVPNSQCLAIAVHTHGQFAAGTGPILFSSGFQGVSPAIPLDSEGHRSLSNSTPIDSHRYPCLLYTSDAADGNRCLSIGVELDRLRCPSLLSGIDGETPWMPHENRMGPVKTARMPVEMDSYR